MTGQGAAARRERGRQEMRQAILEAAHRIIGADGIDALSMRAIARDLGYSPAALYEYFPAKEDVCKALYFEGAGGLNDRMRDTIASLPADVSSPEAFKQLGRAYREYAHEQSGLYRLVFANAGGFRPGVKEAAQSREGYELLIDVARRGVERGDLAPAPAEMIALFAWASVHGFVMLELAGMVNNNALAATTANCELPADRIARDALYDAHIDLIAKGFMRR